jgi:hypothetical protein
MSATEGKSKIPVFDGKAGSFDYWGIEWNVFAGFEGITDALGSTLDARMPQKNKHALDPAKDTAKPRSAANKANR